jgi:hypothetical protein
MRNAFLVVAFLSCGLDGARGSSYDNRAYGFHTELPSDRTTCQTAPPAPDHGFTILLNSSDCTRLADSEQIEVFVYYNVISLSETTIALSEEVCHGASSRPSSMTIDGLRLRRCDPKSSGNLAQETYFALRLPRRTPVTSGVIFEISLYCQANNCVSYQNDLRRLMSGLRLYSR